MSETTWVCDYCDDNITVYFSLSCPPTHHCRGRMDHSYYLRQIEEPTPPEAA